MAAFTIITKLGCGYCIQAKNMLDHKGLEWKEDLRATSADIEEFKAEGYRSFPQIFHGDVHVGGFDQLAPYLAGLEDDDF